MGTPAYMSPEQASGRREETSLATDVYGLGAILYALLTGKAPFGGDNVTETLDAVRNRAPEPPRKLNAGIPRDLEMICLKCLEKTPADRYPTAVGAGERLCRRLGGGEPVSVRAAGAVERLVKWARCKRPWPPRIPSGCLRRCSAGWAARPSGSGTRRKGHAAVRLRHGSPPRLLGKRRRRHGSGLKS